MKRNSHHPLRPSLKYLFVVCLIALAQFANGGGIMRSGIQADFLHQQTVQEVSSVASNVLRVVNYTQKSATFTLNYSIPSGWEMLSLKERQVQVDAGDSIFVPIRLIPEKLAKGGTSYIVSVFLVSDQHQQFAAQNWYISVAAKSQWKAQLPVKQVYFSNNSDSSGFRVRLQNFGNTDENILLTLTPDRHLQLFVKETMQPALLTHSVDLPVGADTTIEYMVQHIVDKNPYLGKKDVGYTTTKAREIFSVQIQAHSTSGLSGQSWSGTMNFLRIGNHEQKNEFGHAALPLTFEANIYDILSDGTTMSLDAYGSTQLKENTFLNYRFQSVFVTNYLDEHAFLGSNHYLGYFSDNATVEIGEVNGWGRSLLTGRGIKGSYTFRKNTFGVMLTRAPGFFKERESEGFGLYHRLFLKKLMWSNYFSRNINQQLQLNSSLYNSTASWKINPYHQLSIGGGFSSETAGTMTSPSAHEGYGYDVSYAGTFKKLCVFVGNNWGNSDYSLARGINMYTSRITYLLPQRRNLALSMQSFSQQPNYYVGGQRVTGRYIHSERYELRYGFSTETSNVALKPLYLKEDNLALRINTGGTGVEYNAKNSGAVRFSSNFFMGYAKAVDYTIKPFFMSHLGANLKWEHLFLSMRYFYGPNQLAEQLRFVNNQINPQSLNGSASYDLWFDKGNFLLTTNANFMYETYFHKTNLRLRPELYYYTKGGYRLSCYFSFLTNKQGVNPELVDRLAETTPSSVSNSELNIGFGIKKQIGIPIPGKKFTSIRVVVFRDVNGNGKQDANESGLENVLVNILAKTVQPNDSDRLEYAHEHGEDFITDSRGEIFYDNIPQGIYRIKSTPLEAQSGWFEGREAEVTLEKGKTVYIALSRGIRLNGSILVERDKYSEEEKNMDLSRIRITAIDSAGKTFSSLTDRAGAFILFLPMGEYTLSVNDAALGEKFIFIQSKIMLDLTHYIENYNVSFNVVEKKRKMEVKHFNSNGEQIK